MEIARLFATSTLARPLLALRRWCWPERGIYHPGGSWNRSAPYSSTGVPPRTACSSSLAPLQPLTPPAVARLATSHRAVRTLHRSVASGGGTGSLVLAGRMADVCAELERLAAREAQH